MPKEFKKLHILILVARFPNIVQPYIVDHLVGLKQAGFRFSIIAAKKGDLLKYQPEIDQCELLKDVVYFNIDSFFDFIHESFLLFYPNYEYKKFIKLTLHELTSFLYKKYSLKYVLKALLKTRLISNDKHIHLIHSHYLTGSYEYLFLKEIFGIPLITTFHGLQPQGVKELAYEKMQRVFKEGDLFLVNTKFAEQQLASLGCPLNKIKILPQGIDLSRFPFHSREFPPKGKLILLSVCRLSPEKGLIYALEAIANIAKQRKVEYRIVGHGPQHNELEKLAIRLNIRDKVKFLGIVDTKTLQLQYAESHIFLLPSIDFQNGTHVETQGVVIQEAQAFGLPVIATKTGGIPESVGNTAILVEQKSEVAIYNAIKLLLKNPEYYRKLTEEGRHWVEKRYDKQKIIKQLLELYEDIIKNNKKLKSF